MPDPNEFKSHKAFMDACMSETKAEGLSLKHRLGKCLGTWRNKKGTAGGGPPAPKGEK